MQAIWVRNFPSVFFFQGWDGKRWIANILTTGLYRLSLAMNVKGILPYHTFVLPKYEPEQQAFLYRGGSGGFLGANGKLTANCFML